MNDAQNNRNNQFNQNNNEMYKDADRAAGKSAQQGMHKAEHDITEQNKDCGKDKPLGSTSSCSTGDHSKEHRTDNSCGCNKSK